MFDKPTAVRDLDGQPFLLREAGSGTREQLDSILRDRNVHVRPKWICHSSDAILSAAIGGQGLAVLSRLLVREAEAQGLLSVLTLEDAKLDRSFQIIYHRNKYLSVQLQSFLREIELSAQTGS